MRGAGERRGNGLAGGGMGYPVGVRARKGPGVDHLPHALSPGHAPHARLVPDPDQGTRVNTSSTFPARS
jgi:hypothetical protein